MFSCLICALYEFCPNPVVKPAEEVCEQSIMQFPPWLVLHSEQFVFFTFQEIQSLEWGDYAGITSFFLKEKKKIHSSYDFIGNLGNICWNDLQVRKKKVVHEFMQDSTAGFHLLSAGNWDTFLQNLTSVSRSVGDQKLSPGSISVYKTLLWQWYPSDSLWSPEELGEMFRRMESGISPIFQHRSLSKSG